MSKFGNYKVQNCVLLILSICFYAYIDWRCLPLVLGTVAWTYVFARWRLDVRIGIGMPIAVLCVFKYFNFFMGTSFNIILPLGVSFYTFMAIAYLLDVHWHKCDPERDVVAFSTFMLFFPQIIAGPIGRANELLPQYKKSRHFDQGLAVMGCRQILWGAFAKFVVADNCAMIASMLLDCKTGNSATMLIGAIAYSVQIYGDFSGYSNMAIGVGKVLGIRLRQNFSCPYFASSFGDFWHRWHMSLTTWFRDYVYFPLGGSRCSKVKVIRNIFIVFLLSGLWHGAAWTFVVWGGAHAALLSLEKLIRTNRLVVLIAVVFAWLIFQAPDVASIGRYGHALVSGFSATVWPHVPVGIYSIASLGAFVLFLVEFCNRNCEFGLARIWGRGAIVRWMAYLTLTVAVICCAGQGMTFIYSKF